MSFEIMKSELDLFKKVSFQGSIEDSQLIQYRPTTALTASSNIEFEISNSSDEYIDLQNVYLWIKGKVVQQDGTDFPQEQNGRYSLINYGLNTMFDQLSVTLGGTLVSQSSKTYHYLSYIEALTQLSTNAQKTFMEAAGFIASIGREDYNFDNVDSELASFVRGSKSFSLYGRIHGSIFNSDRLLLNAVPIHLTFTRAPDTFCLMGSAARAANPAANPPVTAAAAANPKLQLNDVCLFVRTVKLSPNLLNAHARALQFSNATYPIKDPRVRIVNLPANQTTFSLDNVIMGQMPCKVILGFVTNDAFSGSFLTNPLKFGNCELTYLCIHLNGVSFPKNPYEPDYRDDSKMYEREYFDLLMNLGATKSIAQPAISYEHYGTGQCLYAFNLNSDFENPNENEYINIPKEGSLHVEVKFRRALPNALKLICWGLFDNVIEIDQHRSVTVDH